MAYFAQLDENNLVINVIIVNDDDTSDLNGVESEDIGIGFCLKNFGANTKWKQTYNDGTGIRGNYAGVGYTYMENVATLGVGSTDIFIQQKPFPSWTIDNTLPTWVSPIGSPPSSSEHRTYIWDEDAYQADNTTGWTLNVS